MGLVRNSGPLDSQSQLLDRRDLTPGREALIVLHQVIGDGDLALTLLERPPAICGDMKRRLFSLPGCPHCERARAFLAERQVPYVEYDVSSSEEVGRLLLTLTGRTEVPALIAGYQAAVGFNEGTWVRLLRHAEQVDRVDPYKLPPDLGDDPYNRD